MAAVLTWLAEQVSGRGSAEALVDGGHRLTFAQLDDSASAVAAWVSAAGIGAGDRVGLACDNSASFVAAYLGILRTGAVLVPLNPTAPPGVLESIAEDTGMRLLVTDNPSRLGVSVPPGDVQQLDLPAVSPGTWSAPHLFLAPLATSGADGPIVPEFGAPADLQAIIFTSGTTGRPKGVMLTASALQRVAEAGCEMLSLDSSDRVGIITPLFHLYALREVDAALRVGACLVLARNLTFPASVLRQLHQERVTYLSGVPAGFALFVERYERLLAGCGDHLRAITLGTATCPPALAAALHELLPSTRVILTYGLTEASRVCYRVTGEATDKTGSIGRPYPGVELRTVDEEGRALPANTPGRIVFRTGMAASGYWNRGSATQSLQLADRWMLSPDYGRIDEDGNLFLRGRVDDVINSGGEKVSPDEVEAAIREHPQVADCAVLSAADPNGHLGEIVLAVIVSSAGSSLAAEEVTQFCAARLEQHKVPRAIRFVESLPRTALGKVDRGRLRAAGV
ncbi:MAG: class I adenylate-forming enzyme family protein [Gemmatimonadaceae bacterium]